jgi:hypothetical protein
MPDDPTPNRPTIDERIEAVVQTLELLAAMQRDHEKHLAESDERFDKRFARWDQRFEKLLTIAESHERRIQDLEHGEQH